KHRFIQPFSFDVKLLLETDKGCKDSITKQVLLKESPQAKFDFSGPCRTEETRFINQSHVPFNDTTNFTWDFGDGISSLTFEPKHVFSGLGMFDVKLKASSSNGCMDSIQI